MTTNRDANNQAARARVEFDRLPPHEAETPAGAEEPRFYIEHNIIHDRKTGRHLRTVLGDGAIFDTEVRETLAALNAMDAATQDVGGVRDDYARAALASPTVIEEANDFIGDEAEPLTAEEVAELEAHEGAVVLVAKALMQADGDHGDPHRMIYSGGPIPEPWCEAWQRYEDSARAVVEAAGSTAAALARAALASHRAAPVEAETPPPQVIYSPIETRPQLDGRHPNDNEPRDDERTKYLDMRGDDRGQGLDCYWKWGHAAGWNDHKMHVRAQTVEAETPSREAREPSDEATPAYAEGRGDQFEDDCAVARLLFENLDDADIYSGGFINTTRVRELLDHFDLPREVECSGLGCTRPECDSMGCTADRINDERDRRVAAATGADAGPQQDRFEAELNRKPTPFLQPQDLADLERLDDLFSDDEGWDLPKARMQRLAELGVIRRTGGAYYQITSFGLACLREPRFPLQTAAEFNEEQRQAMLARTALPAHPREGEKP